MKTNVLMKIAVVFMAAFGAYAFSGNNESHDLYSIKVEGQCTNILAGCSDSGLYTCKISTKDSSPIFDLNCTRVIMHELDEVVQWTPLNL